MNNNENKNSKKSADQDSQNKSSEAQTTGSQQLEKKAEFGKLKRVSISKLGVFASSSLD